MKNKTIIILTILALVSIIGIVSSGCASNGRPAPITLAMVKIAANSGASVAIADHPDWRPAFVMAHDELGIYLANGKLTGEQLADIMNRLPVKELKSNTARIIISSGVILFDVYISQATDVNKVAAIADVGRAIYDGLDVAIKSSPEQLQAVKATQLR